MSDSTNQAKTDIKVLLVEDHKLTRIGLKTVIERTDDLKVIGEAENGEEAVAKASELKPDVILMDVGMPVMDGIEAVHKIREQHKDINTIMLTSHDNERDILASLSAGACGYCLKDVEPDRLYTAIRSVNEGDVWLDSTVASRVMKAYGTGGSSEANAASKESENAVARREKAKNNLEFRRKKL